MHLFEVIQSGTFIRNSIGRDQSAESLSLGLNRLFDLNVPAEQLAPMVDHFNRAMRSVQSENDAKSLWDSIAKEIQFKPRRKSDI